MAIAGRFVIWNQTLEPAKIPRMTTNSLQQAGHADEHLDEVDATHQKDQKAGHEDDSDCLESTASVKNRDA